MNHTRPKIDLPPLPIAEPPRRGPRARYRGSWWRGWHPLRTPFETAGTRTLESDRALNASLAARAVAWRARALLLGGYPLSLLFTRIDGERERERVNNSFEFKCCWCRSRDRWMVYKNWLKKNEVCVYCILICVLYRY